MVSIWVEVLAAGATTVVSSSFQNRDSDQTTGLYTGSASLCAPCVRSPFSNWQVSTWSPYGSRCSPQVQRLLCRPQSKTGTLKCPLTANWSSGLDKGFTPRDGGACRYDALPRPLSSWNHALVLTFAWGDSGCCEMFTVSRKHEFVRWTNYISNLPHRATTVE